ncbi:hypothetical protein TNCV_89661 [Trichonephila clavipes]|nr:hypothetical protein TNCV_89661 [Trichonephila clavipes]
MSQKFRMQEVDPDNGGCNDSQDCELILNHCRPSTYPGTWYHFLGRCLIGGYQSLRVILTPNFLPRGKHLSSDDVNLYQDLILPRASKTNKQTLWGSFTCRIIIRHCPVNFLHQENPPTWFGLKTMGTEDLRQTNHATQPACIQT